MGIRLRLSRLIGSAAGLVLTLSCSRAAFASGFEKTVFWSGRYAGIAGITASNIEGSESLAYNPAGLLTAQPGQQLTADLSPVASKFQGPIGADNTQDTGIQTVSLPYGLLYSISVSEQLAFGVGTYAAGGSKVEYGTTTFPIAGTVNNALNPIIKTDLAITEIGIGAAYKPMQHLRLGAVWRISMATADFSAVSLPLAGNSVVVNPEFSNLKDTQWNAYRLGAQWTQDTWGLGLAYRSEVRFNAAGNAGGNVGIGNSGTAPIISSGVVVNTSLPQQVSVGGHWDVVPKVWRALVEYDWTQYSRIDNVGITGSFTANGLGATQNFSPYALHWQDQHNIRLAGEYDGAAVPIRFGYAWTSQVTPADFARAAFVPPGQAHTFTLGSGLVFLGGALLLDGALDYTRSSGSGVDNAVDPSIRAGTYTVAALAMHIGLSYKF